VTDEITIALVVKDKEQTRKAMKVKVLINGIQ
jgi:hypothetical protein